MCIRDRPDTGEQALEITEALIRSGAIDIIAVSYTHLDVYKRQAFGDDTVKAANDLGYICYKWDVDTIDWMDKDNPDKIIQRIQKKDIKDGSIVLMHPTKATSICLDEIISIIRTRGYVPVSYTHLDVYKRQVIR